MWYTKGGSEHHLDSRQGSYLDSSCQLCHHKGRGVTLGQSHRLTVGTNTYKHWQPLETETPRLVAAPLLDQGCCKVIQAFTCIVRLPFVLWNRTRMYVFLGREHGT